MRINVSRFIAKIGAKLGPTLGIVSSLAILAISPQVAAQTNEIKGKVVDSVSGESLPGVNITVEGSSYGTVSGPTGTFSLLVDRQLVTVVFSMMGYETQYNDFDSSVDLSSVRIDLDERPIEIPEIFVERVMLTGGKRGLSEIPGSAHYLGPRELEAFSYNDIQRILQEIPGVNIQEEDGYGLRPNIGMRGTGAERSSKITVMEDGVLMAPAPYAAPAAYYFPTAGRMEAVEVRKGSSQIKYGPYTTGGAINLISTQIPDRFSGYTQIQAGAQDNRTVHAYAGHSFDHSAFLIETYQASTDGFKDLESGGNTGFDKKDYLAKVRFNTNRNARIYQAITFKVSQTDEVSNETYLGITDSDFDITPNLRYSASQADIMTAKQQHYIARYLVKPSSNIDITTTFYRTEFARDWYKLDRVRATENGDRIMIGALLENPEMYAAEFSILRGDTSPNGNALELKHNNREYFSRGVQSVFGFRTTSRSIGHNLEIGVRYHQDELDRFQWVDFYRMQDNIMELTQPGVPGTESNRIESATAFASYVQYAVTRGRTTVTPGVRYEHIDLVRTDYGKEDPQRIGTSVAERSNVVQVLIPGIGLTYDITNEVAVFSGVHQGFGPPGSQEGSKPEKSVNYELGSRYRSGVIAVQAVGFFSDYSNLLGADLAASGGQGTTDLFNGGEVNASGLEFAAGFDFASLTTANLSIPVNVGYTFTRSEFVNSFESDFEAWGTVSAGDQLPYIPSHQLSVGTGLVASKFSVHINGKYVSEMRTVAGQGDHLTSASTDAHFVADVAGEYAIGRQARVFTTVQNVTDSAYIVARRPAGVRPGLPRLFQVGIKTTF